ncbi:MAG: cation:proton antiporter [Gammaproteobacteria bacterium]|nr:cation:proton antiporter [Gammaproteobacteria bacterium]NNM00194.1 cation:proton antiporter [Gammaproteobacteria bacterium]
MTSDILFATFLIFAGGAVLATVALVARQAMIVAYILLGVLLGPSCLALIDDPGWIEESAGIGIIFLLYLLGMNMEPRQLAHMLREAMEVTLISCLAFGLLGFAIASAFGFTVPEALLIGATSIFSSTIIGLKLLPTTTLHHKHTGQVIIAVLLLQDLLAIVALLVLQGIGGGGDLATDIAMQLVGLPLLIALAFVAVRYVLEPLLARFDQIHEYIFLVAIAWGLGMAEVAALMNLSHEIGAFIAGVALASSPIALFIADSLRPLRDFFLVLFFFSLGAGFNLDHVGAVIVPAAVLAAALLIAKPYVFRKLLVYEGERNRLSGEIGFRLGQMSEFSFLIAVLALEAGVVGERAGNMVQLATLLSFIVSAYLIVNRYPTPIAVRDSLRKD